MFCSRRFGFDAGHRVLLHESKCKHLHGHRYEAEIQVRGELDSLGRVIDFGVVKDIIGNWIDSWWDHNLILNEDDPLLKLLDVRTHGEQGCADNLTHIFGDKMPFVMPNKKNPTAENLAENLFGVVNALMSEYEQAKLLSHKLRCSHVRLYETPNCWSDFYA